MKGMGWTGGAKDWEAPERVPHAASVATVPAPSKPDKPMPSAAWFFSPPRGQHDEEMAIREPVVKEEDSDNEGPRTPPTNEMLAQAVVGGQPPNPHDDIDMGSLASVSENSNPSVTTRPSTGGNTSEDDDILIPAEIPVVLAEIDDEVAENIRQTIEVLISKDKRRFESFYPLVKHFIRFQHEYLDSKRKLPSPSL